MSALGAKAALDGFDYQVDVSVFVALKLLLISKSATQITLEPVNDEDLEVDLDSSEPGFVQVGANTVGGYKLMIQVKLRNTEPWSLSTFKALLNHGTRRRPAKHHLDNAKTRYLLITSADTKGEARNLAVRGLEEWPEAQTFPKSLSKILPHTPEGRVAIWGVLTERTLDLEIKDILGTLLRVPSNQHDSCRTKLRDEALSRMRGIGPGVWKQEDLLHVIREYNGYLASAPALEAFVPPANFDHLKETFAERNAVVIKGPSGTGKTLTAIALLDHVRQGTTAPEIIQVNVGDGPSSTRALVDRGPKLFYIEDPWGQYSLRGGSDAWTEQLPKLLRSAHANHQYVITSRSDMLGQSDAESSLRPWSVVLNADHYREGQLKTIFDRRLDQLSPDLQSKALAFRQDALGALETPYEIDLFFTHLADRQDPKENDRELFQRLKALAHRDAVEGVVGSYLGECEDAGAPALIWGLLAARTQFNRSQLTAVNRQLRTLNPALSNTLEKLVDQMVATRHLRQPNQSVSFAHPSVRAGFDKFIKKNAGESEMALQMLVNALARVKGPQQAWCIETAARSLNEVRKFLKPDDGVDFTVAHETYDAIDTWLEESLVDPESDFRSVLQLASDVGSKNSTPSELARWLIKGIRRGGELFFRKWKPPHFDDAWYTRVSDDERSFVIADRFVREQLPRDQSGYGNNFAKKLERISQGLTPAFVAAAQKMVGSGFDGNVGVIATGAVRDVVGYKPVLDGALDELEQLNSYYEDTGREEWRAIQDGERDAAHEEGYQSHHEDDGYAAGVFVETYVSHLRSLGRWQELTGHPRVSEMMSAWASDICKSRGQTTLEEARAVLALSSGTENEARAWDAARAHWSEGLGPVLQDRILSNPEDAHLRKTLVHCALLRSPATLANCFERLAKNPDLLVQLLVDLRGASRWCARKKDRKKLLKPILKELADSALEIFKAVPMKDKLPKAVGPTALSLLVDAASTLRCETLNKVVPVMISSGSVPSDVICRWLRETTDDQLSRAAAQAAVAIQDDELVRIALHHTRAGAREEALNYLAPRLEDPLPQELLQLASDPGNRVRRALVAQLNGRHHADHVEALRSLIQDSWSNSSPQYYESPSYPIAFEAIKGLAEYENVSDEIGKLLVQLAELTDDRALGSIALETAAQCCGPDVRAAIWALSANQKLKWVRVDAINALVWADRVEDSILEDVTEEDLLTRAAPLAASLCALISVHGHIDSVIEILEGVAHSARRRALILIGVFGLSDRDESQARGLLDLLKSGHPARRILDLIEEETLPASVLDDLGDIRIRRAVQSWLSNRIESM